MTNTEKSQLQKEVVDSLDKNPHGRLILAPRVGKTKIVIDLIKRDKPQSILWVTPSAKLAKEDIPNEFIRWKAKRKLSSLITCTYKSLCKKEGGHYDLVVLDEDQFLTENTCQCMENISYNNIISMTGTDSKSKDKIEFYEKLNLKVLYNISIRDAVDAGVLSNYSITVIKEEYDKKQGFINKLENDAKPKGTYQLVDGIVIFRGAVDGVLETQKVKSKSGDDLYRLVGKFNKGYGYLLLDESYGKVKQGNNSYVLKNNEIFKEGANFLTLFNQIKKYKQKENIAKFLIDNLPGRMLMFCTSIDQANSLCENNYHSKTNNTALKAFQNGEIDKITMVSSGGTGFTYREIDHLVIVQADSDRNGTTSQKICRTLLAQKNYEAKIWIICLEGTTDQKWVNSTLENFDSSKIESVDYKLLKQSLNE